MTAFAYVKVPTEILFTHADPGEWAELHCYGALQPERGHFANRAVMDTVLGKPRARRCVDRGDVTALADGRWVVTEWDFQEGDRTVKDRMARWRAVRADQQKVQKLFPLSTVPTGKRKPHRIAGYGGTVTG